MLVRKNDKDAFLFNLTNKKHFPVKNSEIAIFCRDNNGPSFGMGELFTCQPFDKKGYCAVSSNEEAFMIPSDEKGVN